MNKINLLIGDVSGDGHDKKKCILIECNIDVVGIQKAYKKGVKKVGFNLSNEVAAEYEDNKISHQQFKKLKDLGYDGSFLDEKYSNDDDLFEIDEIEFAHMFMFFVWLGNKDVVWEFIDAKTSEIDIGGYGLFE